MEEAKKIKHEQENHKKLLENIKSKKIDQLKELGIQDKYLIELSRKKIIY